MGAFSFKRFPLTFLYFYAESEQGVAQAILRGLIDFKRDPWPNISESAKSLVRQMLEPDPKLRLTAKQVLGNLHLFVIIIYFAIGIYCTLKMWQLSKPLFILRRDYAEVAILYI